MTETSPSVSSICLAPSECCHHRLTKMAVSRSTEGFSKLWAIHHQGPEDSMGSLEEVWKTNKPISHSAALVATSKHPLLGPAQTGEGFCLSLPPSLPLPP